MPVPSQLGIVLLLEPNLAKEVGHSSVHGQRGNKIRVMRDCIQKDVSGSLGVLEKTPWKKNQQDFQPIIVGEGKDSVGQRNMSGTNDLYIQ